MLPEQYTFSVFRQRRDVTPLLGRASDVKDRKHDADLVALRYVPVSNGFARGACGEPRLERRRLINNRTAGCLRRSYSAISVRSGRTRVTWPRYHPVDDDATARVDGDPTCPVARVRYSVVMLVEFVCTWNGQMPCGLRLVGVLCQTAPRRDRLWFKWGCTLQVPQWFNVYISRDTITDQRTSTCLTEDM